MLVESLILNVVSEDIQPEVFGYGEQKEEKHVKVRYHINAANWNNKEGEFEAKPNTGDGRIHPD